jgi:hypothetical protein
VDGSVEPDDVLRTEGVVAPALDHSSLPILSGIELPSPLFPPLQGLARLECYEPLAVRQVFKDASSFLMPVPQQKSCCHRSYVISPLVHQRNQRVASLIPQALKGLDCSDAPLCVLVSSPRIGSADGIRLSSYTIGELLDQFLDASHGQTPFKVLLRAR